MSPSLRGVTPLTQPAFASQLSPIKSGGMEPPAGVALQLEE